MTRKKQFVLTPETIDKWQRTKKLENVEYRVVCAKDIINGKECIHIAPSKNTLHEDIMFEIMRRNPSARDMAGRVLLYDMGEGKEPLVKFDTLEFPSMLTQYWDWDERVIPHLEPLIKQRFQQMRAEGKKATLHIDHSKDFASDDYWDRVFAQHEELNKKFAGRNLMSKIEDFAPKNPQEEQIKEQSLRRIKREHDVEQAEAVRAHQDSQHNRISVLLWKQAKNRGD